MDVYNKFTLDDLKDFMKQLNETVVPKVVLGTGKLGVLQYYAKIGVSEETLKSLKEKLPERYYEITENGVKGIDY